MIGFAPAKINIGLRVVAKRPDGYHDIESCFYPVPLCDIVEVIRQGSRPGFSHSGIDVPGTTEENLCLKAYELLQSDYSLPSVRMHLHKAVPVGAGLGGGSSDASQCLLLLNEMFEIGLSEQQLGEYALQLGSDCPFFIKNMPCMVEGRGEKLTELSLPFLKNKRLLLIYPSIHVSTAEFYQKIRPNRSEIPLKELLIQDISEWKDLIFNDFEEIVFNKYLVIKEVKNYLYRSGALYASMSGTGSAVYGIFDRETVPKLDFPPDYFVRDIIL